MTDLANISGGLWEERETAKDKRRSKRNRDKAHKARARIARFVKADKSAGRRANVA